MREMDYVVTGVGARRTITPRSAGAKQRTREAQEFLIMRVRSNSSKLVLQTATDFQVLRLLTENTSSSDMATS